MLNTEKEEKGQLYKMKYPGLGLLFSAESAGADQIRLLWLVKTTPIRQIYQPPQSKRDQFFLFLPSFSSSFSSPSTHTPSAMSYNNIYPKIQLREYPDYVPHNTVELTLKTAAVSFGAGFALSAIKNSFINPKQAGIFHPKLGAHLFVFTAAGSAFTFGQSVSANLREKNDAWNTFIGGAAAGAIIGATCMWKKKKLYFSTGARKQTVVNFYSCERPFANKFPFIIDKTLPKIIGFATLVGSAVGIYEFSGGLAGFGREKALSVTGELTELEDGQKQGFFDVVSRRPLSQTLDELGDLVRPFK